MNHLIMIRKCFALLLLFAIAVPLAGQTDDNGIFDLKAVVKNTAHQTESKQVNKTKIEQEYLEKARRNIEKYRKGDASLRFADSGGGPLKGVAVEINQVSQDFLFGNIYNAWQRNQGLTE